MGTVFKFPDGSDRRSAPHASLRVAALAMHCAREVLIWIWMLVRVPLFLVLYWLRMPVMFVCNLVSIPTLCAFLFALYAFPDKSHMVVAFGVVSFGAFVVLWTYDLVLGLLSPQEIVRTL